MIVRDDLDSARPPDHAVGLRLQTQAEHDLDATTRRPTYAIYIAGPGVQRIKAQGRRCRRMESAQQRQGGGAVRLPRTQQLFCRNQVARDRPLADETCLHSSLKGHGKASTPGFPPEGAPQAALAWCELKGHRSVGGIARANRSPQLPRPSLGAQPRSESPT